MGIPFEIDIVKSNLERIDASDAYITSSMHKDIKKGRESEIDGLVFEAVRLGKRFHVATPVYLKIAKHFGYSE